ncbi:MAG TPA: SigE family RNA polymerase sigma factor [Actinocrinis sp.]|uniref:SigE family RNA polymerase sigma factor n=1 Tax=Actinocrinis sp. TaxID=1920516 RepID=UPI002DDD6555|nr:SigE family RNA polymerase sigma factor [Actinocrinis sp.]HEV2345999.1 SigE family RNA polymerase sigma factor [Actinocrinis sp.]
MDARARAEFEEFVTARSAALFRTAVLLTGNRQDAQDLVQSALERACRHWDRVAAAEQPEAYVRRILVNGLKDRWRLLRRLAEVPFDDAWPSAPSGQAPFRQVELRRSMIAELRRLPVGMRSVLVLRYFEDLSEAEIARALNCSTGTVKSQAARGLARLRASLGPAAARFPTNQDAVIRLLPGGDS